MKQADGTAADVAVTAPAAGTIYGMSAVVGATPSVAGDPLFSIAQNGEMDLLVETPVNTMSRLAVNQGATADIIGVAGSVPAKVRFISGAVDQTSQLGEVRLQLNFDQRLRVGAFGAGKIELEQRCGPALPLSAVVYADEGAIVQVVRDDFIESRKVTVGSINGDNVEIREGLAEGETVVARAGAFVRDGDQVRPISAGRRVNTQ